MPNTAINKFRIASREVFNHYFRREDPYENDGWDLEERFRRLQDVMWMEIVIAEGVGQDLSYGLTNRGIVVVPTSSVRTPIMISDGPGSRAHPVVFAPPESRFAFMEYFDWDQLAYRDNQYTRLQITEWPGELNADLVGREALIEAQYVTYESAT